MKKISIHIGVLTLFSIGAYLSMDMYVPSFPALVQHFGVKAGDIQLSLSLFVLMFGISQFISGVLSDRFGRRPILSIGIGLYGLGSFLALFAPNIFWFNMARVVQGLGIGAGTSLARIILNDLHEGKAFAKKMSILSSLALVVSAVAPFFGGFLQRHFNYHGSLVVMLVYSIMLGVLLKFYIPETSEKILRHVIHPGYLFRSALEKIRHPEFTFLSLVNGFIFSLVLTYLMVTPFVFHQQFHFSAVGFGGVLLLMAFGTVLGAAINYKLLNFFSAEVLVRCGLGISSSFNLIMLLLTLTNNISWIFIVFLIIGINFGVGLVLANNVSILFKLFTTETGLVGALYGFLRTLVAGVVGSIISSFHLVSILDMSIIMLVINVIALGFYAGTFFSRKAKD